jgi:hypothetical protein
MFHNLKWITAILLAYCLIGFAQSRASVARVFGRVVDDNDARIAGATVTLKNLVNKELSRASTTDVGEFIFDAIKPGRYELSVESLGMEKHVERLLIKQGEEKELDITLGLHHCPDPIKRLSRDARSKVRYCSVHRKKLRLGVVPIVYGLVVVADDASKEFPNANWEYYGGCVADCYEKAEVLYCPQCRKGHFESRRKRGELIDQGQPTNDMHGLRSAATQGQKAIQRLGYPPQYPQRSRVKEVGI